MVNMTENTLEQAVFDWFESLGWKTAFGPDISPDLSAPGLLRPASVLACEREGYSQVVLVGRLRTALENINPNIPADAIDEAVRKIIRTESPSLIENNRRFHRMLTDGVDVSFLQDGREVHDKVWLLDLKDLENNDWLVVNQFTVIEDRRNRRPDIVIFVNGLPLGLIELKNPTDEKATIRHAFNQLQTYKNDIPSLFIYNEFLVVSDGFEARSGTLTAGWDRFMPWRTIDGKEVAPHGSVELEVLLKGVFEKRRFLDLVLNFVVFDDDGATIAKKAAAYHQFHTVNKAVECTLSACGIEAKPNLLYARYPKFDELNPFKVSERENTYGSGTEHFGGRRIGVIWHTQGSGKSLLMAFFAGKIIRHPAMENPTLLMITDRNDLDDQLFGTFSSCRDLLRQTPVQAENREHLKELLQVPAGGVVLTNNFHHLYYTSIEVDYRGLFPTAALGRGIFYILNTLWYIFSFLLSFILCLHHFFQTTVVLRKRTLIMLIAVIVCLINYFIYISKVIPWSLDIGPLIITINGLILSIAITRLAFLNISPIAREQVFESMQDGVVVTDPQGRMLDFNNAAQLIFPNLIRDNIGLHLPILAPELKPYLSTENISKYNPLSIQKGDSLLFYETRKIPIKNKQNKKIGVAVYIREFTEHYKLLQKLQEYAEKDWLTGIWNRRKWMNLAKAELNRAKRYGRPLTIAYLDIDHFKLVNDNLGHEGGDTVLIHLVKNISSQLRENDIFGRIGGEEFIILFPELDKEKAQMVTQRLLKTVSQEELITCERNLKVTISIGATIWDGDKKVSLEELIQKADKALYMSKAAGRNRATFI